MNTMEVIPPWWPSGISGWDPAEDNLHNLGFTFDVFGGEALKPQAQGENTFYVSGGESDVAIDYEVYMNVEVLQTDIDDE
jgi:hypothetical protein